MFKYEAEDPTVITVI